MTQVFFKDTLIKIHGEEIGTEKWKSTVNEVVAELGKGSGKDYTIRISFARIVYLLHCLRDPSAYYGIGQGEYIDLLNIALNSEQAQRVFFDPFKNILTSSPYFQSKGFNAMSKKIEFHERPIRCFSGHSEAEGWEGYNLLAVVLDEISAFKGLPHSEPVLTPSGWRKNGELRKGDSVVGKDGKPTEIMGVFPMGEKEVFEVEFEDGAIAKCSNDHIWHVKEYSDGRRISYKDLQLKDFKSITLKGKANQKRYSVPVVNAVEYEPQRKGLPIDPYVLGILIGDGSLTSPGSVRFSTDDQFVLDQMKVRLPMSEIKKYPGKYDYGIIGGDILNKMRSIGLFNHKSESKFIPDPYLYSSIEERKLLLAGLMDSDGTYARGQGSYTTVSERLKNDLIELCRGLGGIPTASKHKSWASHKDGTRRAGLDKWMICPRMPFNPFLLPRKADKWKPHRRSLWRSIVDVRPLGYEEEMTCIKVSNEDGLYVISDYIVTHNTQEEMLNKDSSKLSAKAIYDMARLSTISRFPAVGKVALLSFPRFENDFIEQRYKLVIEEKKVIKRIKHLVAESGQETDISWDEDDILSYREPKVWAIKAPTFIANPTKTAEDFTSDFIRDPIGARARLLCMAPKASEAYFRDQDAVRSVFHKHTADCLKEDCARSPVGEDGRFLPSFKDKEGPPRFIHIDLGLKRDRSALAMVHCSGATESPEGQKLPVIDMDLIKYWEAPAEGEIDFSDVRRMVFALSDRFSIAMITIDRWNSVDSKNIFMNKGLYTDFMVVAKKHYDTLATCIYDKRIRAYFDDLLVEEELLRLQLIRGTKVDHVRVGYKDGADCLAGAVYTCTENTVIEDEIDIDILGFGAPDKEPREREPLPEPPKKNMPSELQDFIDRMSII